VHHLDFVFDSWKQFASVHLRLLMIVISLIVEHIALKL
jgi:hypothetical protein